MQVGARLAHFEVVSLLGSGGTGEVWKARDAKLDREVALKTLAPDVAKNAEHLARLQREATLLASVNHPNIAAIHGLEEHAGERFLVLELVDGETVADRLQRGPLPVEQSMKVALQIASALEAAHERGVIHRDLKPANVKINAEGIVKVLDFGLAKTLATSSGKAAPTQTVATEIGAVMGTPPYMSPEQARGEAAGRQTDIWSLGVVLYEMLSGDSPFAHDTTPGTLARVLEAQPDYSKLPPSTPPGVRRLLRRCLEKDCRRRAQHIGDVRIELEDTLAGNTEPDAPRAAVAARPGFAFGALVFAGLAVLGGLATWALRGRTTPPPAEVVRLSIPSLERPYPLPFGTRALAVSDDGSRVAYTSATGLLVRPLRGEGTVMVDTLGTNPFFSPDGQWIGLVSLDAGLVKVPVLGGAAVPLVGSTERSLGADWGADGAIVYATTAGLFRVAETGGEPELLARANPQRGERAYAWPEVLPGGRFVLVTVLTAATIDSAQIVALDLRTRESKAVVTGGSGARYAATGHIVYNAGPTLRAVAFDVDTATPRGTPISVANTSVTIAADNGAAQFDLAANGTFVYLAPAPAAAGARRELVWVDRQGNEEPLPIEAGRLAYPRISPDGTRVAFEVTGANRDVWIWDLRRATQARLTTDPAEDMMPLWSADGSRVIFSSNRAGTIDVYSQAADGATAAKLELGGPQVQIASALADGDRLTVYEDFRDLKLLDLATSELTPLLVGEADERLGVVSPDGKWIAYESDELGAQIEIVLRPFPNVDTRREKVSIDGGRYPRWGLPGSNELYYVAPDGGMMAASIESSPTLRLGGVSKLFSTERPSAGRSGWWYDVSPVDGRFLISRQIAGSRRATDVSVVLNWFTELREQFPPEP